MHEWLTLSAMELAAGVRSGAISPVDLLEVHIERIQQVNPVINAVIVDRFEAARAEARAAEERVAAGSADGLPPLLGVPCTVKEFLEMEGLPNTGGVMANKGRIGRVEATVVSRVRQAGAIVLGLTNVPEGGLWMEADSKVYGRTRNPWNPKRSPGGSSGGEGAIVAAGGSPFGLGADIGGSIRIPSAFCGTVGHKPSGRLVPTTGHFPLPDDPLKPMLCLGPMTRRVGDLMPLLRLLAGPDGTCPVTRDFELGDPETVKLEGLVVHRLDTGGRPRIRPVMADAIDRCLGALEDRGARIETIEAPEIRYGVEMWAAILQEGTVGSGYGDIVSPDRPFRPLLELLRLPWSRHTAPALIMALAEPVTRKAKKRAAKMIELSGRLRARLAERLGDGGVFLFPPYTRPAPGHFMPMLTPFDGACTCTFNPLELAITVLPVGFAKDGMPVAVQIGALPGGDHLTIAVAGALEAEFGGWTPADPQR